MVNKMVNKNQQMTKLSQTQLFSIAHREKLSIRLWIAGTSCLLGVQKGLEIFSLFFYFKKKVKIQNLKNHKKWKCFEQSVQTLRGLKENAIRR